MTWEFIILLVTAASTHEKIMGEHLRTWSETEYTNAGEVMQNVGKIQEGDAKKRYRKERGGEREREREGKGSFDTARGTSCYL